MAAKPSNRKKPDPGENHPSRRKKIPPSKEVQRQTEKNYDPKTGKHIGALPKGSVNKPFPGRPIITGEFPPLGGWYRNPDRTPWNRPGRGGEIYNSTVNPRNKNLGGMLNFLKNWNM